ncbi:hypothetical protein ACG3SL_16380 [Sphingomonas sp. CJ20]
MNDQGTMTSTIIDGGPAWLTLSFVLIAAGMAFALFILAWGTMLAKRRSQARAELEARGEVAVEESGRPLEQPAVPVAPSPAAAEGVTEAPAPAPLADEPIAAAAPLDASPAALAASDPAPVAAPEPAADAGDDLTRLKGVGPRLAERLNALGITRFAQLAALAPEDAAALDAQLGNFQGRLQRDRWIEQAGFLASGDVAGYEAVFGKL